MRGFVYCVCRTLGEQLSRDPDLLTKKMGPKLQTLLHVAATFNRYTVDPGRAKAAFDLERSRIVMRLFFFF